MAAFVIVHVGRLLVAHARAGSVFPRSVRVHPGALRQHTVVRRSCCPAAGAPTSGPSSPIRFIHASWVHLGVNAIWFLPFGSAVARRFGPLRFLAFFAVTAAAGAMLHLFAHGGDNTEVIGASAAISGTMAGAMRFAFQRGGPLGGRARWRARSLSRAGDSASLCAHRSARAGVPRRVVRHQYRVRHRLPAAYRNGQTVAWQAHIGGFLAGLLLFAWFDPPPRNGTATILVQCRIKDCAQSCDPRA